MRVSTGWLVRFGAAWLGVWLAQLTVVQLLLPQQVDAVVRGPGAEVLAFGWASAAAGATALVVLPVAGALSDRVAVRRGRRPWVGIGTLVFAAGLVLLGLQTRIGGVVAGWTLALAGFAAVSVALVAVLPDRVPVAQRGVASAFVSGPQAAGTVLGLAVVVVADLPRAVSYAVVAALLVLLVVPFLLRGEAVPRLPAEPDVPRVAPRDFGWTLAGRLLVNLGNAVGTTLLLYFLADALRVPDPEGTLVPLVLVYLACLLAATAVCGRASDAVGRRRPFVAGAAVLQALAAVALAVAPGLGAAFVAAALLGAGYGVFLSVDQALATQVLADPARRGRDLGLMTAASVVPQALGPLVGGAVVAVAGWAALFVVAAVLSAAGAAASARVRGVA